jgi:two-component system, OmpR family, phosphate regulon sensor histidine kinase PhoR
MISFRKKIFITYAVVFLLFLGGMYPFATSTVQKIATKAMYDSSRALIEKIQNLPNDDALIRHLKEQKATVFFRTSVINNQRKVLYDSHTKRVLGPRFNQNYVVDHPEVHEAFKVGRGYSEDYSELLGQKFAYMAISFDFHGKEYVLRTAFPFKYITELTRDFETGVIALAAAILLLFSLFTWFIINHLTRPIQQMITAVRPYHDGLTNTVPVITISGLSRTDEFVKLADTFNSLSAKIRKQIESLTQERNEKEATLESLVEGVVAVDVNMRITYANQTALKFLDMPMEQLINTTFTEHMDADFVLFHNLLETCGKENRALTDTIQIKRDGKKVYLDIVAAPKKENSGAILVLQDKTSHHKLHEMRKDFVANASHELKTPITIIHGFAEMLHDHPDLADDVYNEVTNKIVRNCHRMTNLIKDLLTLTDVEHLPESRLSECNFLDLLETCSESVKEVRHEASIVIHAPEGLDSMMMGDPHLLEHAFLNLIDNAAKYSTPPADINITVSNDNGNIVVSIADKGIGIPAADLEYIFQRFYTVDKAHSRKMGGSGLGLSIVETIIEKHFGHIAVKSELNVGTTFTVVLPIKREVAVR